jgi:photosystem II stability/assembly factor-like uncharacterized protein
MKLLLKYLNSLFNILLLHIILFTEVNSQSSIQKNSFDELIPDGILSQVPDKVRNSKPYLRHRWFYEQRAYPNELIPDDAYSKSIEQRDELRHDNKFNSVPEIEWTNIGPTPGYYYNYGNISGRVATGAFHPLNPDIIYIGPVNGGVWKSTNAGINWQAKSDFENSLSMGSIAIDPVNPDIIYAGTGEATYSIASYYGRGLLKSTDGGNTWVNITSGLPATTYFARLKIRPNHSEELLAALGTAGLYRSVNSGTSWTQILSGRVDDIVFSPTGDSAFAVGSGIGIRRSIDGGVSFTTFGSSGLASGTRTNFDLAKSNPSTMWAAVYASGAVTVYKSTNFGLNWSTVTMPSGFSDQGGQAWYDLYCLINPKNHNKVYIGTIDIYRTTDGLSFTNITNGYSGGNVHVDQHFMIFHPTEENTIIACNDGGIWKSTNNGTSFTNLNQKLTLTQFYRIAASPFLPSRVVGGTQDNGTQRTDSTLNWATVFGGDGGEVCFNPLDANYILGETQNNGVFRTTNGGVNWSSATSGLSSSENRAWVAPIIHHPTISGTFYTARQRIYKSTNNAGNWTAVSGNVNGTNAIRELKQSQSNPSVMFATSGALVFKSTNEGVNWTSVTVGLPNRTITSVYINPSNENEVFLTFSGFSTDKVYKSTSGGSSWTSIHGNLPDSPVNDFLFFPDNPESNNTYFVANDIGVFVTENGGVNWIETTTGLPNTVIMHLDYSPSTKLLRAGTHGRGVFEAIVDFSQTIKIASITVLVEGLYDGVQMMQDTIEVQLRNSAFPYSEIENQKIYSDGNGLISGNFTIVENGVPYYIVIKHRNSIETWSALPQMFTSNQLTYDFTTGSDKAYGNNLKLIGSEWCIFSGDVNQDGFVNTSDVNAVYTENINGIEGYVDTDLNGDNFTETEDLVIVFTNKTLNISIKKP